MWYVMQVRTGTEENIRCQCQRLISSDILKRCFIPYYQQKKRFQGKWHIQERILFPGYVFLIAENLEQLAEKETGQKNLRSGDLNEKIPQSECSNERIQDTDEYYLPAHHIPLRFQCSSGGKPGQSELCKLTSPLVYGHLFYVIIIPPDISPQRSNYSLVYFLNQYTH